MVSIHHFMKDFNRSSAFLPFSLHHYSLPSTKSLLFFIQCHVCSLHSPWAEQLGPHTQRLFLFSSCRLRSCDLLIRASRRSCVCRYSTGNTRHSLHQWIFTPTILAQLLYEQIYALKEPYECSCAPPFKGLG